MTRKSDRRMLQVNVPFDRRNNQRRTQMEPTEIEKTNLEAHVEMSYSRYEGIDVRLNKIELQIEEIEEKIDEKSAMLYSVILKVGCGVIGVLVSILIAFITK